MPSGNYSIRPSPGSLGIAARWTSASLRFNKRRGLKWWPQVVAMAELNKDLQTESQHTECIGQLTARSVNIFISQPHRKHVMMIAGGVDGLEVLAFFRDQSILRSGLQTWSFCSSSGGLRWLSKLLFSSLPAMGFVPELPPLLNTTPKGLFRAGHVLVAFGSHGSQDRWLLCRCAYQ